MTVDKFKAFSGVKRVFDIKGPMKKSLVDIEEGVKASETHRG